MATPKHQNPSPGGHEIYSFDINFLGHNNYILSLSDLCMGVKRNNAFHCMTYGHAPAQESLPPGS